MSNRESELKVRAIHTDLFKQGDDLSQFIIRHLPQRLREGAVIAVTSKIVSLAENATVSKRETTKQELVGREADQILIESNRYGTPLTIKAQMAKSRFQLTKTFMAIC